MKYILFALLFAISCKNNNQTATAEQKTEIKKDSVMPEKDQANNTNPASQVQSDSIYRLAILFYSIGEGIENDLVREYRDSIDMFSQNLNKKVMYDIKPWGREGETDIVMKLNELNPDEQKEFVKMSKRVLSKGKWVNIYENYPYRKRGR
jgi:hypothetical protein